jgi:hypothetical protein
MQSNWFELSIEIEGGRKRLPEYGHKGKTFVEGRRGYPYQIKFRNSRAERVLVVPSVDGLSVIDGKPATPEASGYIVQAYSSLTISGWRTSMSEIRQFEFSEKSGSYAGKTEGQLNCGIIAVQVFGEKKPEPVVHDIHIHHIHWPPPPPPKPWPDIQYTCSTGGVYGSSGLMGSPGPSGPAGETLKSCLSADVPDMVAVNMCQTRQAPDFNLGTAYGAAATDRVTYATFERGLWLATLEIYYSDRDGLLKDGIQVDKSPELATGFPTAFGGFCKPPGY